MNPLEAFAPTVIVCAMVVLAVAVITTLLRALIGPRMSDRIIGINMIGTQVICIITCLMFEFHEAWMVDIAIVYAMFNFLAVIVLTKIEIGAQRKPSDVRLTGHEKGSADNSALSETASEKQKEIGGDSV